MDASISATVLTSFDWSGTPLGPFCDWSPELKLAAQRKISGSTAPEISPSGAPAAVIEDRSYQKLRSVLDSITDGLLVVDAEGRLMYLNAATRSIISAHGPDPAMLIGQNFFDVFPETHKIEIGRTLQRTLTERIPTEAESYYAPWQRWFNARHHPSIDGSVSTVLQDITKRKAMEEQLRRSEQLYRAIGESIDYGVWVCRPDGRNTYASESFLKLVGITQEECSNYGWGDVLHPDDAERTIMAWKECVRTGGVWDRDHRFRGVDGAWHHVLARGVPVRDENGVILYWAGINLDIGGLKQTEAKLSAAHQRLEALLNSMTDGVAVLDKNWCFTYFSEPAAAIIGIRPEGLLGHCVWDLFPKAKGTKFEECLHRAMTSGKPVHFEEFYPEPLNQWLGCHAYPMEEGLTVYFQDITERRCAEESLRETKATLEFTLASAQIGDWDYDLERDESRRSLRHDQCFGYNEPIPRDKWNFNIFLEHVHPDDRASMVESFQAAVKTRRAWQDEYRVCWPDGTLHWISARGSFYRPKDGIPTRMLGIVVDITDRKQDELALQQANLELAKKAADLEKLIEQRSMA